MLVPGMAARLAFNTPSESRLNQHRQLDRRFGRRRSKSAWPLYRLRLFDDRMVKKSTLTPNLLHTELDRLGTKIG